LTGATGYVGGRLLPLLAPRYRVRCLARRPEALAARAPRGVEVAAGDLLDPASLGAAMNGVDAAVYLVHSLGEGRGFEDAERRSAQNFAAAAAAAGVGRILYLGGLAAERADLSPHLRSRHQVGDLLRASGVPVVELRASIIIGSGSLSFEMVRALVERLPVMITPRWVRVHAQPIAIGDVLAYLEAALALRPPASRTYEIGGPDVVTYGDIMLEYARQRGLRRFMLPVPVLTPRLSSLWLGLVTPLYARVGRKLIESIEIPSVVSDDSARLVFPEIVPRGLAAAIARALDREEIEFAAPRWSDALSSAGGSKTAAEARFGNRRVDSREAVVAAPPEIAFAAIERIGGETGWYYAQSLWRVRGWLDLLVGGVGLRRGRRDPRRLAVGDALDWWRVEAVEPGRRLRLAAEMKLPGRAWLEFEVEPDAEGARIRQTASFDPLGLAGLAYWYVVWPVHQAIFAGMLRRLARQAETDTAAVR
jgi:uncharacterized protein YbjT (DUF2867 family)